MINRYTLAKVSALISTMGIVYNTYSKGYANQHDISENEKIQLYLVLGILMTPFGSLIFTFQKRVLEDYITKFSNCVNGLLGRPSIQYQPDIFDQLYEKIVGVGEQLRQHIQISFAERIGRQYTQDQIAFINSLALMQAATLPAYNVAMRDLEVPWLVQGLPNTNVIPTQKLPEYTPAMSRYLKKFEQKDWINNSCYADKFKFSDKILAKYSCTISKNIADIPVLLDDRLYDLKSLLDISLKNGFRLDPITRDNFSLQNVQPARNIQEKFENHVNECIKQIPIADKNAKIALQLFKQQKYVNAKTFFENAIQIYKKLGVQTEQYTTYLYNVASTYDHLDAVQDAILLCEECLNLRKELYGDKTDIVDHTRTKLEKLREKLISEETNLSPVT